MGLSSLPEGWTTDPSLRLATQLGRDAVHVDAGEPQGSCVAGLRDEEHRGASVGRPPGAAIAVWWFRRPFSLRDLIIPEALRRGQVGGWDQRPRLVPLDVHATAEGTGWGTGGMKPDTDRIHPVVATERTASFGPGPCSAAA
jgi:hypothetical protein